MSAATPPAPEAGERRSGFADALRAFALFGICVVNLPFIALPLAEAGAAGTGADAAAAALVSALFEAKFFLLFSFLFGFGFAAQLRRIDAGRATPAGYARRLLGLFAFGLLHALLLFPGDILMGYAVLGACLWAVRRWSDGRLLLLARGLAVAAAPLMAAAVFLVAGVGADDPALLRADAADAARAFRGGNFADGVARRAVELLVVAPFIALFNWPLAFAAFCVGVVAGRRGLLGDLDRLATALRLRARWLAAAALVGNLAFAAAPWLPGPIALLAVASLAAAAPCLSALYVLALARLWRDRGAVRRLLEWAAPAGRMSLTNYLGGSLAANALFMGWGLGLFGQVGRGALLVASLFIAFGLLAASRLWLRRFAAGPDEWLLRSWTALRWQPFRRGAAAARHGAGAAGPGPVGAEASRGQPTRTDAGTCHPRPRPRSVLANPCPFARGDGPSGPGA